MIRRLSYLAQLIWAFLLVSAHKNKKRATTLRVERMQASGWIDSLQGNRNSRVAANHHSFRVKRRGAVHDDNQVLAGVKAGRQKIAARVDRRFHST
jgi:hypothetical protein